MMFHVVLESELDGPGTIECPALPGCVSEGKDEKEALANIKEAIQAWLWAEDLKRLDENECDVETVNLTVPNHKELGTGILRKLNRFSGMTVKEFKALL